MALNLPDYLSVVLGDMCVTMWAIIAALSMVVATTSSVSMTPLKDQLSTYTENVEEDLPFDNVLSIERVLDLLPTENSVTTESQLAALSGELVSSYSSNNMDDSENSLKSVDFNGSAKLRDEVARTDKQIADDLAVKLIDQSVWLIINATSDLEDYREEQTILNFTSPSSVGISEISSKRRKYHPGMVANKSFLIAYGSQTGQAESIANQIFDHCNAIGLSPRLHTLDQNEKEFHIENEPLVIIVISSTGDGDPPENAARFMRRICRKTLQSDFLAKTTFALLGLGDSNYSTFQGVPKKLEKQLVALGARSLVPRGEADDQVGLELAVEPWIDLLYQNLTNLFAMSSLSPEMSDLSLVTGSSDSVITVSSDNDVIGDGQPMLNVEHAVFPSEGPCLIRGSPELSNNSNLKVPANPAPFLDAVHVNEVSPDPLATPWQNGARFPGMEGELIPARVVGSQLLTDEDVKKPKYEITIDLDKNFTLDYLPGDAFYFVVPNPEPEVNYILNRLGLLHKADQSLNISLNPHTTKRAARIAAYLPTLTTLRYVFTNCLDIRRAPSRPLLRTLANNASDESEKRRLLELVSHQGIKEFTEFVSQASVSLCDVLLAFPSCRPTLNQLLELLPRLMPRPFSVASYNAKKLHRIRFVYSIKVFLAADGRQYERRGLATEWLTKRTIGDKIKVIYQTPTSFRLIDPPRDSLAVNFTDVNLIMIGPGTGVAPFMAFLERIKHQTNETENSLQDEKQKVTRMLFCGCRQVDRDGLYIDQLYDWRDLNLLSGLFVAQSEVDAQDNFKYVQDKLRSMGRSMYELLNSQKGYTQVFVCGDANGMAKGVWETFVDIVEKHGAFEDRNQAITYMSELKKAGRYREEAWS
uniref:Methionine synthase reductase n=1 Tax=Steinernema glaseri TaxID=37863 RepID=A0A1I7Z9K3_9BILA